MEKQEKTRQIQFDLLKIVGMLMIIALHVLTHGVQFPLTTHANLSQGNYIMCMLLRSFCIVAVNCYFLITGYFLINQEFKSKKIFHLWGIVLFYVVLFVVIFAKRLHAPTEFILQSLATITSGEYWFFTAYLFLFILSPVLNMIFHKITQVQFKFLLFLFIFIFMITGIISPYNDMLGEYLILDAMIIYGIGAYIRLYGHKKERGRTYFLKYVAVVLLITFLAIIFRQLFLKTGNKMFNLYYNKVFSYGSIFCLLASIYLFLAFGKIKINNIKMIKIIQFVQPLTFAVYLIHDNVFIRKIWSELPIWIMGNQKTYIFIIFFSIISMFLICCMIEYGRKIIFYGMNKIIEQIKIGKTIKQRLDMWYEKIDKRVNKVVRGEEKNEST